MGLSVSYSWVLPNVSASEVRTLVDQFAAIARRLSFVEVAEPLHLVGDQCDPDRATDDRNRWTLIKARSEESGVPAEIFVVQTLPGEGCETADFGFRRTGDATWSWSGHCKTQYAANSAVGGLINFFRSHTRLCKMLDAVADLQIVIDVHDDTNYWATREHKVLKESIEAAQLVGLLV